MADQRGDHHHVRADLTVSGFVTAWRLDVELLRVRRNVELDRPRLAGHVGERQGRGVARRHNDPLGHSPGIQAHIHGARPKLDLGPHRGGSGPKDLIALPQRLPDLARPKRKHLLQRFVISARSRREIRSLLGMCSAEHGCHAKKQRRQYRRPHWSPPRLITIWSIAAPSTFFICDTRTMVTSANHWSVARAPSFSTVTTRGIWITQA